MRKKILSIIAVAALAAAVLAAAVALQVGVGDAAAQGPGPGGSGPGTPSAHVPSDPSQPLTAADAAGLAFMRQEEKLARDVYVTMAAKWGQRAFTNIAAAEQTHLDDTAYLLDRYALVVPVAGATPGVFANARLAALYVSLVEKGSASLVEALTVGATIEDLDIADVENLLAAADNLDVRVLTQNLAKGSRNHLRSFVGLLDAMDAAYVPQFIPAAEYDEIIATEAEHKVIYDADGNPVEGIANGPCAGKGPKK